MYTMILISNSSSISGITVPVQHVNLPLSVRLWQKQFANLLLKHFQALNAERAAAMSKTVQVSISGTIYQVHSMAKSFAGRIKLKLELLIGVEVRGLCNSCIPNLALERRVLNNLRCYFSVLLQLIIRKHRKFN